VEVNSLSKPLAFQDAGEASIDACLDLADQLKELLNEEACALKRFDSARLLQLLPTKQYLIEALAKRLELRQMEKSAKPHGLEQDKHILLRSQLAEINRLNHANGVFISETLSLYEDFFSCLWPSNYAPEGTPSSVSKFEPPKGLTFRKEI
jgi:flagellar biosynthesis/type III secretory pathway chaperone